MNAILEMELEDLEEVVIDEENNEEVKERFKIKDLDGANWAFRKLKAITSKKREIEALADKEIEPYKLEISRILEWRDNELASYDKSIDFFYFLLEEYYREQRKIDAKFKLSTPHGKISSRKQQPKWNYDDETIIKSLKINNLDSLIKIKEEVKRADLKKEASIIDDVYVFDNEVLCRTTYLGNDGVEFVNIETGEIYDWNSKIIEYYDQLVIYDGKVIRGITVEEQPDSISIKVEV